MWQELGVEMKAEMNFHRRVGDWGDGSVGWEHEFKGWKEEMEEAFDRDEGRKMGVYDVGMVEKVREAKKRRVGWKREKAEKRKAAEGKGDAGGAEEIPTADALIT